jgi:hypothetical protein
MRDPLAPIPSHAVPAFWHTAELPRSTRVGGDQPLDEFSPLRLLQRDQGDTHGLDRRSHRRDQARTSEDRGHGSFRLLSAVHRTRRVALGLCTAHGWALVHTLSVAPAGVLVHLLDLLSPDTDPALRRDGRALLARVAPVLGAPLHPRSIHQPGSPLATIGGCLLAPRVVADLSTWASQPIARRGASRAEAGTFAVTLLAPGSVGVTRIEGELVPMTDPQPQVLAVALSERALGELERSLAGAEIREILRGEGGPPAADTLAPAEKVR